MSLTFIPCYCIKSDKVIVFQKIEGLVRKQSATPKFNTRTGLTMSNKSASRIKEAISLLYASTKNKTIYQLSTNKYYTFKVNFLTLTLPTKQVHSDKEIHKNIFEKFIRKCRIRYKGFLYVYKIEVQDNGNLHYHLNTNTYIHYMDLRNLWNNCCRAYGYINEHTNPNPNSTDVKAVKNKTQLALYMSKYISKSDKYNRILKRYHKFYDKYFKVHNEFTQLPKNYFKYIKRKIDIKLWDCSNALKGVKNTIEGITFDESADLRIIDELHTRVNLDYATIFNNVNFKNPNLKCINKQHREMIKKIVEIDNLQLKNHTID